MKFISFIRPAPPLLVFYFGWNTTPNWSGWRYSSGYQRPSVSTCTGLCQVVHDPLLSWQTGLLVGLAGVQVGTQDGLSFGRGCRATFGPVLALIGTQFGPKSAATWGRIWDSFTMHFALHHSFQLRRTHPKVRRLCSTHSPSYRSQDQLAASCPECVRVDISVNDSTVI